MISVLINWLYVFAVTYIIGHFFIVTAFRLLKYDGNIKKVSSVMAGLAITTMYAGYFSIFSKVGVAANTVMIAACAVIVFAERQYYADWLSGIKIHLLYLAFGELSNTSSDVPSENKRAVCVKAGGDGRLGLTFDRIIRIVAFVLFFAAVLFYTTEGQFFSDSGYYHEQSIRWIEEYGTVKGSVHILKRLAYNSCYFCQCALFSMRDLFGQSLHCLGGFYALIVAGYALLGFDNNIKINALRCAPIIYFIMFCSEITSPASDFPLSFAVMYVAIRWFELREDEESVNTGDCISEMQSGNIADYGNTVNAYVPYALLALFVVFIISIKLTVGCLVLITVYPAIKMVRDRKIKESIGFIVAGITVILPYFIRNYIICGWLIYPFTAIDIFNPDWKLMASAVQSDADEIKIWGRGMGLIGGQVTDSITTWLPHWWEYMSIPNRRIIVALVITIAVYVVWRIADCIVCLSRGNDFKIRTFIGHAFGGSISGNNTFKCGEDTDITDRNTAIHSIVFEIAVLASLLYWFMESPLFRYGTAYILVALMYMTGNILQRAFSAGIVKDGLGKIIVRVTSVIGTALCVAPLVISLYEYIKWDYECVRYMSDYTHIVMQEDYPRVEYSETSIEGITFYYPKEELGQIGYHIFPALWYSGTDGIVPRGDKIEDGFRSEYTDN